METVCVKTEPSWDAAECTRPPAGHDNNSTETPSAVVKREGDIKQELYAEHEVLDDLVLSRVGVQPRVVTPGPVWSKGKTSQTGISNGNASMVSGVVKREEDIKQEPIEELYAGHEVRGDLVLGRVGVQPRVVKPEPMRDTSEPESRVQIFQENMCVKMEPGLVRESETQCGEIAAGGSETAASVSETEQPQEGRAAGRGGAPPHKCPSCARTFGSLGPLNAHLKVHTGEKPYSCDKCPKRFCKTSGLKKHYLSHTGIKAFSCETCKKEFVDVYTLRIHERVHSGIKPYSCETCKKAFATSSALRKHERTHTGEKPYSCKLCSMRFIQVSGLREHELTHTGKKLYPCEVCKKYFGRPQDMRRHMRLHTGEKPFSCAICKKQCRDKGNLKSHERTHTGDKPYSCEICRKRFTTPYRCKQHERRHNEDPIWRSCGDAESN